MRQDKKILIFILILALASGILKPVYATGLPYNNVYKMSTQEIGLVAVYNRTSSSVTAYSLYGYRWDSCDGTNMLTYSVNNSVNSNSFIAQFFVPAVIYGSSNCSGCTQNNIHSQARSMLTGDIFASTSLDLVYPDNINFMFWDRLVINVPSVSYYFQVGKLAGEEEGTDVYIIKVRLPFIFWKSGTNKMKFNIALQNWSYTSFDYQSYFKKFVNRAFTLYINDNMYSTDDYGEITFTNDGDYTIYVPAGTMVAEKIYDSSVRLGKPSFCDSIYYKDWGFRFYTAFDVSMEVKVENGAITSITTNSPTLEQITWTSVEPGEPVTELPDVVIPEVPEEEEPTNLLEKILYNFIKWLKEFVLWLFKPKELNVDNMLSSINTLKNKFPFRYIFYVYDLIMPPSTASPFEITIDIRPFIYNNKQIGGQTIELSFNLSSGVKNVITAFLLSVLSMEVFMFIRDSMIKIMED